MGVKMSAWTAERRIAQACNIQKWRPWGKSTGPRSLKGKEQSKMNSSKGKGRDAKTLAIKQFLTLQHEFLLDYNEAP